jgi:predicted GH43/DUF377 family glycosyl hydrolase
MIKKIAKQKKARDKKMKKGKVIERANKKKAEKKKQKKVPAFINFIKSEENPIISPRADNGWEAWQTFNPGVILLNDKIHFLYRAIGSDGISRLGYAVSSDGFVIEERLPYPVYEHRLTKPVFNYYSFASGGSFGGAEDPRPVRVNEEERIYMTYTACDGRLGMAFTSIKVDDFLNKKWEWRPAVFISPPGEVHKNWVIFPEKIKGKYAILTSLNPEVSIAYLDDLDFSNEDGRERYLKSTYAPTCRENGWDACVRGAGPPPIKTKYGWLLFYHAIDKRDPGKYKVGAMLLDLNDPTKILVRSPEPVLEPSEVYEYNGFKGGVVYASGAVLKDGKLFVYYGAADSYIGVAYADFNRFLEELTKGAKPKLGKRVLKKK